MDKMQVVKSLAVANIGIASFIIGYSVAGLMLL